MGNQRNILSIAVAAIAIIAITLFVLLHATGVGSSSGSPLDPELKSTADQMLPAINRPGGSLPIPDASLKSFQAWVYDVQAKFASMTARASGTRYRQLYLSDPSVMPPQAVPINQVNHAFVVADSATISKAIQSGQGHYTTVRANSEEIRMYIVPISVPAVLKPAGVTGVLEVIEPQK